MMAAHKPPVDWREQLPDVEGRYEFDAPLAPLTWFRVGGPADVLYRPANVLDLCRFLRECPEGVPKLFIGIGSNLLIRDGGFRGIVIRLGKPFATIRAAGDRLIVGGGALDITVANAARDHSLGGMEFLRGIPGSIGGAVAMNAGAYGRDMSDILESVTLVMPDGSYKVLAAFELRMSYRTAHLPAGAVIVEATLKGEAADKDEIQAEMDRIVQEREDSQPLRTRTGGSTFKNPEGAKAWELIDKANCRGLTRGGAQVSPKHCNFLLNHGEATAKDIEYLGEEVRQAVFEKTGVMLDWEIRRVGEREVSQ
ncbi:MAG: UDP-N-acetylmuramate dehydrogenase [Sphingomonadales bacterium]|jgi:UDP-N-acetylmuramate dehydrogenase